jgi:hypothetical protein
MMGAKKSTRVPITGDNAEKLPFLSERTSSKTLVKGKLPSVFTWIEILDPGA